MTLPLMRNYIDGEWVESDATTWGDVFNPAKGEKIARVAYGTAADVDRAVQAALAVFPIWRETPPLTRARYLFRLKDAFEENFEEIAETLTTEHGKAIDEARGEVRRMIENVEHATGVTTLMCGYTLEDIAKNIDCYGHRQPMGVFGCIAPYNFPAMVPWWFLPYAVVTGNTFVFKPSEQVPMTQTKIMEIVDEVGFPEGDQHGSRIKGRGQRHAGSSRHPGHQLRRIDTHGTPHLPALRCHWETGPGLGRREEHCCRHARCRP